MENKENARPWEGGGGGGGGGGAEYREDYANESDRVAAKLARKESLNIKLALRPDRQELINRYTHSFGNQHGLPMFLGGCRLVATLSTVAKSFLAYSIVAIHGLARVF